MSSINRELLALSKNPNIDSGILKDAFRCVTETLANALSVSRASIWLYNADHTAISCVDLYETAPDQSSAKHTSGSELKSESFPAYFSYLAEQRILRANNAHTDPATHEFSEVYLKPLGINSMLDAPIRLDGKMIGVICNEHVGAARGWTGQEEAFVANVSDIVARAFQANERPQSTPIT